MKTMKLLLMTAFVAGAVTLSAQVKTGAVKNAINQAATTAQEVKPNIIKKLPEKQQAMYDQMAADLKLTAEQKDKVISMAMERAVSVNEKMKTATTEEQKKEIRKSSLADYNKKLDEVFGADLSAKIQNWVKEYTLTQKAAATTPAQSISIKSTYISKGCQLFDWQPLLFSGNIILIVQPVKNRLKAITNNYLPLNINFVIFCSYFHHCFY